MEGVVRGNVCPIASTLAAIVAPAIVVQKRQKQKSGPHFFFSSGDDKFIQWLRECREGGIQVKTSKSSQTDLVAHGWILFFSGSKTSVEQCCAGEPEPGEGKSRRDPGQMRTAGR